MNKDANGPDLHTSYSDINSIVVHNLKLFINLFLVADTLFIKCLSHAIESTMP